MDSAWWTSKTAGKQLIMSPNMVTRIKPNWEQIKIWFQVSFVIRHGTCRDCEMLQCGTTERHSCFKVLALDRAVRNLCKFLHLPLPSSREWKVDDLVLSRRISCAIWTAQAQNFQWHLRSPGRRLRVREAAVDGTRDSLQVMQGDQGQRSTADTSGETCR